MRGRITIAGVPVDPLTFEEAIVRAEGYLEGKGSNLVVTPNPEMAVLAAKDAEFRRILESADLALADGYGLKLAGYALGARVPETVTGVDFTLGLAALCEQKNCSLFLLGGGEGTAQKAAERLQKHSPKLIIAGAESGGRIRYRHGEWEMDDRLLDRVRDARPDVLVVALGHGKQERWIRDHLEALPSVRIAIGVGGALDYLSGKVRRAPKPVRALHLEWLWRLTHQPWRVFRILTAVVLFPLIALVLLFRRKRVR